MIRTILLVAVLVVVSVPTMAADLLRCRAKNVVSLQEDGSLQESRGEMAPPPDFLSGDAMLWWDKSETYIVDMAAGTVRMGGHRPLQMIVAQEGNGANDTILVPLGDNPRDATNFTVEDLRNAATDFIRIRQWKNGDAILFVRYGLDTMVSGTCEPIQ
jgi:hypothetical protein